MDEPPPLRPPETHHHRPRLRSAAYQAAPSRRNATPTTLPPGRVLGFPPVRGGKWRMATTDTLQEGMVAPIGVTASEPAEPARISPAHQPHRPTEADQPNHRPTPCAIADAPPPKLSHYEHQHEAKKAGEKSQATGAATPRPSGREPPPPPSCERLAPPARSRLPGHGSGANQAIPGPQRAR